MVHEGESGLNQATNCCCSPTGITGMRGGLHPDHIESIHVDVNPGANSTTGEDGFWGCRTQILTFEPVHILGGSISFYAKMGTGAGTDIRPEGIPDGEINEFQSWPVNVSICVMPNFLHENKDKGGFYNSEIDYGAGATADKYNEYRNDSRTHIFTCALNAANPTVMIPDHLWGYFADGGLYIECQSAALTTVGARVSLQYVNRMNFSPAYGDPLKTLQHVWHCRHNSDFLDGFFGGTANDPGDATSDATPPSDGTCEDDTLPGETAPASSANPTIPPTSVGD